ncbi:hypothetical protein [Coleofasciculus sp. G1-WW12-02]|uniref:hypothetical protein n=1 Tax=Coleofasciculus sp. G1-WW12-02 TaxID=3068483 RepID=UPI0040646038
MYRIKPEIAICSRLVVLTSASGYSEKIITIIIQVLEKSQFSLSGFYCPPESGTVSVFNMALL